MAYKITDLEAELPTPEMNDLVTEILASSLKSLGLFSQGAHKIADLGLDKPPSPYYERWLSASIRYLQEQKMLAGDLTFRREVRSLADLWAEWEEKRAVWATSPDLQTRGPLLEACLKALPGVLSGTQRATDVIFPNSSTRLVEGVHGGNTLADHFNEALGATLTACIDDLLQAGAERKIRILEIGAGMGGATAKLLPLLQQRPVEEYCYTDVSSAFLMYAEKRFQPLFPALRTAIFDVSKPLAGQSVAAGHYDFAIAANALHATPDIRETVRNAKATLKNRGVLLLNEISAWSLFNHVTFGLLEGWWLNEDTAIPLPGSPGLAPERWREILAEEGFESVRFPAEDSYRFGRQIIAATSNGWTRQRIVKQASPQSAGVERADAKTTDDAAVRNNRTADGTSPSTDLTDRMNTDYVRQVIIEKLSESVRMDASIISNDAPFAEYGVESIIGVNLVRSINEALQIELEPISLFEYSTVDQLTRHILENWLGQIAGGSAQGRGIPQKSGDSTEEALPNVGAPSARRLMKNGQVAVRRSAGDFRRESDSRSVNADPIAIIGMSGRFGESESLEAFWENLAQGRDLVKPVSRWRPADCVMADSSGQPFCSHGSFVDSIDQFDPAFFGISPKEATYMDPQQRLFLEESWRALEDAGYAGKSVHEKQCGVYVGCGSSNYDMLFTGDPPPHAFWGNSESVTPARIAYYLDLNGPAIAVDTACSSSLVAIHLACQGLWSRETDMALAGGVFLQPTPRFYQVANRAGMLSPDGKCYSFDARANGFPPGEGVGVVVLKRLHDALEDKDYIHGVIAGSGVNQDGKSNGLIAPNGRAQERLERSVYDRFKIDPGTIQVVEAHGTGTLLGD
jgi:3-oxoacyl-(acyl-carrier-protein) synthase/SAM-dependent methyltransferase/acyl carrier protein